MAVWVYMGDQAEKIDPLQLESTLSAGWSLEPDKADKPAVVDSPTEKEPAEEGAGTTGTETATEEASAAGDGRRGQRTDVTNRYETWPRVMV